jgi:ribonuclease D
MAGTDWHEQLLMSAKPSPQMHAFKLVSDNDELNLLCERWSGQSCLALDTEFIRVNTFYPKPGLIQVADDQGVSLLDPLQLTDWKAFIDILQNSDIVKVLHSGSEDLILFLKYFACVPSPLFDTQRAAGFLGYGPSISYLNLVREITGVSLAKGETRSDWLQRPLTDDQLNYAGLDVQFLLLIYENLRDRLAAAGYLSMLLSECEKMREIAEETENDQLWPELFKQMGAAWRLNSQQLGVLKSLCVWREQQARLRNKPRTWIARDADLISLAERRPDDIEALRQIKELTRSLYHQDAVTVLRIINSSKPATEDTTADIDGQPLNGDERRLLKRLQKAVASISLRTGIAEELLAKKRLLIQIMRANPDMGVSEGASELSMRWPDSTETWRRGLLEPTIIAALTGHHND